MLLKVQTKKITVTEHARLLVVGGSPRRQRLEHALDIDALAVAGIAPPEHFVVKHLLEVPVCALDCAVLVSDARIVARRHHAVMGASTAERP
jgi:hypothetical protein